jgi:hypothetical protein
MACYWTPVSSQFLSAKPLWAAAGLTQVELGPWQDNMPGIVRWVLLDDPGAPDELDGRDVEPVFGQNADGTLRVASRNLLPARDTLYQQSWSP